MARIEDFLRLESMSMFALYLAVTAVLFKVMDYVNPEPYMDEVYHVPQAQRFCNGTFSDWDPKITTLPGLYIFSCGILGLSVDCNVFHLRLVNLIFAVGNYYVIYHLNRKIQGYAVSAASLTAFTLVHFPLLHFFTFFYYTDCGSTFFVLLMYLLSLHDYHLTAALFGYVSVLFRQSNIVWVFFTAAVAAADAIFDIIGDILEADIPSQRFFTVFGHLVGEFSVLMFSDLSTGIEMAPSLIHAGLQTVLDLLKDMFGRLWGYAMVGVCFLIFLIFNRGVVVGDREMHKSVFHLPQLFYFACFTVFFSAPHVVSKTNLRSALMTFRKRIQIIIVCTILSFIGIYYFTHAHPYLLADNRHYTFYVWNKVFTRHPAIKFALLPVYILCLIIMHRALNHMHIGWRVIYFFCVFISLVPQKLLEFRYFIIPYMMFRLHLISPSFKSTVSEFTVYAGVDALTLGLYMFKPFDWEGSSDKQRFMW